MTAEANPEAMILLMLGGDPACADIEPCFNGDRFERLFCLLSEIVTVVRANMTATASSMSDNIFDHLAEHFSDMPDEEDRERANEIITGLFRNPREIEDLAGNQIEVIHDTAINVGVIRTLILGYNLDLGDSDKFVKWMMRYRTYLVV